eukprot:194047-Pyramimonas_sp.AAC.1
MAACFKVRPAEQLGVSWERESSCPFPAGSQSDAGSAGISIVTTDPSDESCTASPAVRSAEPIRRRKR